MNRWFSAAFCGMLCMAYAQDKAAQPASQPTPAPATQPADAVLRQPEQADLLRKLLARRQRPEPILPRTDGPSTAEAKVGPDGHPLLVEGTFIAERPGRLEHEDGEAYYVFNLDGEGAGPRRIPILRNQLLELLEQEAQAGYQEFIVSADVTRYRGSNYLLLRKVLRRLSNGNLGP